MRIWVISYFVIVATTSNNIFLKHCADLTYFFDVRSGVLLVSTLSFELFLLVHHNVPTLPKTLYLNILFCLFFCSMSVPEEIDIHNHIHNLQHIGLPEFSDWAAYGKNVFERLPNNAECSIMVPTEQPDVPDSHIPVIHLPHRTNGVHNQIAD